MSHSTGSTKRTPGSGPNSKSLHVSIATSRIHARPSKVYIICVERPYHSFVSCTHSVRYTIGYMCVHVPNNNYDCILYIHFMLLIRM